MSRYTLTHIKRDIHRPKPPRIIPADEHEVSFIDRTQNEPKVKVYLEEWQCEDYYFDRVKKEFHYPIKLVSIQGMPFFLKPGENEVPATVYEFLEQTKDDIQRNKQDNQRYTYKNQQIAI